MDDTQEEDVIFLGGGATTNSASEATYDVEEPVYAEFEPVDDSMAGMIVDEEDELGSDFVEVEEYEDSTDITDKEINKANKKVNKWIKGIAAIVGAVVLLIALLVSCGKSKEEAEKIATEMPSESVSQAIEDPRSLDEILNDHLRTLEESHRDGRIAINDVEEEELIIENPIVKPPIEDMTDDNKDPEIVDMTTDEEYEEDSTLVGGGSDYIEDPDTGTGSGETTDEEKDPNTGTGSGEITDEEKDPNTETDTEQNPNEDQDPVEELDDVTVTVDPGDKLVYEGPDGEKIEVNLGTIPEGGENNDFAEVENNGITDIDANNQGGLDVTFNPESIVKSEEKQATYEKDLEAEREESGYSQEDMDAILAEFDALYAGTSDVSYTFDTGKTR